MSHWALWRWLFWHWVLWLWILCPDTNFLVFLLFQKHFCPRAGVFSVSGTPQKYFQNTLENTIKFCSFIGVGCVCIFKNYGWTMKNNSTSCSINKQRGIAKNFRFRIRFLYMQKFLRKFLFAFLFFQSKNLKNWANWVSQKHFENQIEK